MSGSKENCSLETLQKILRKHWPDYVVAGNTPKHPQTLIIRREGIQVYIVQVFDKNYLALKAMTTPGWEPGKVLTRRKGLFHDIPMRKSAKPLLKEYIELLIPGALLGDLFNIPCSDQLAAARSLYKLLKN